MPPIDIHVGKRVEQRRKELGLQLEILSIYFGISIADLCRIESGSFKVSASQVFILLCYNLAALTVTPPPI